MNRLSLHEPLPDMVEYREKSYALDLSFDNVLSVFELLKEDLLLDHEKVGYALTMLLQGKSELPLIEKSELLDLIFTKCILLTQAGKQTDIKTFDFIQDAGYIYSSFMMDYGIDLFDEQGRLHWWKFISLFQGLSERTKIREVMSIRSRKLPEPTKYNYQERSELLELKAYYALEQTQEERERCWQNGLEKLADILKERAVN